MLSGGLGMVYNVDWWSGEWCIMLTGGLGMVYNVDWWSGNGV